METPTLKGGKDERPQSQRGGRVKDETGPTSTPRADTGNRTGTDVCMSFPEEAATGERVVPTTQTRLTGSGGSQHTNLHTRRYVERLIVTNWGEKRGEKMDHDMTEEKKIFF